MILRVTFSDNAQITLKSFISLHLLTKKFKHNLHDKGSDKEPLSMPSVMRFWHVQL